MEISEEKIQTLADFWPLVSFLFDGPVDDPAAFDKTIRREGGVEALSAARDALAQTEPFDAEHVEAALRGVVERLQTKPGKVFQPVRVAIAGQTVSPGIFESVALLGKDETLARIDSALARATGRGLSPAHGRAKPALPAADNKGNAWERTERCQSDAPARG